jgi:cardiolipin synthase A/B
VGSARVKGFALPDLFASSPSGGSESMELMYLLAIAAATRSIDLANAYFVPDGVTRKAMIAAARRGARIRVITPGPHTDERVVRRASRGLWGELLEAGIEIYEYQPTMFHCKLMVVDGLMTSVGSTNFDVRSFRLNDEANLNIYDSGFAARMTQVFEADMACSKRITLDDWKARPWQEKLRERALALLGPLL